MLIMLACYLAEHFGLEPFIVGLSDGLLLTQVF
jgi:hypothetical protein